MTKKTHTRTAAIAVGVAALGGMCIFAPEARSADHRDGDEATGVQTDPTTDINDLFSFTDGSNLVMAMTVFPFASNKAPLATFSTTAQYVFHTRSEKAFLGAAAAPTEDIICTFASATSVQCWVGTDDYVSGDPSSATTPLKSASGKVQVYAGLRADPFHFDLCGFRDVETAVQMAAKTLKFDKSGCPLLDKATATSLVATLSETTSTNTTVPCPGKTVADDFAGADTLALVVSVDKSLVTKDGPIVGVWAATYKP